jgi:hypothetical protein
VWLPMHAQHSHVTAVMSTPTPTLTCHWACNEQREQQIHQLRLLENVVVPALTWCMHAASQSVRGGADACQATALPWQTPPTLSGAGGGAVQEQPRPFVPTLAELGQSASATNAVHSDNAFPHLLAVQFLSGIQCPHTIVHKESSRPRIYHGSPYRPREQSDPPLDASTSKRLSRLRKLWTRVALVHGIATNEAVVLAASNDGAIRGRIVHDDSGGGAAAWWKSALACDRAFQRAHTTDPEHFAVEDAGALAEEACRIDLDAGGVCRP